MQNTQTCLFTCHWVFQSMRTFPLAYPTHCEFSVCMNDLLYLSHSPWRGMRTPQKWILSLKLKLMNKKTTWTFSFFLADHPWLIWDKFTEHVLYARPNMIEPQLGICSQCSVCWGAQRSTGAAALGEPRSRGWERRDACRGEEEMGPGEGHLGNCDHLKAWVLATSDFTVWDDWKSTFIKKSIFVPNQICLCTFIRLDFESQRFSSDGIRTNK